MTPEWAPQTEGGIGRVVRARAASAAGGALVVLDRPASVVRAARNDAPPGVEIVGASEWATDGLPAHAFRVEAQHRSHRLWRALRALAAREPLASIEFVDFDGPGWATIKARRLGLDADGPPLAVHLHGTVERTAEGDGRSLLSLEDKLRIRMERYALRHADRIIAPSAAVAAEYAARHPLAPDVEIAPPSVERPRATAIAPRTGRPLRLGFLGRIQPIKGPETLVRAAIALLEEAPSRDVTVELVGPDAPGRFGGSHLAELRRQIPVRWRDRFVFHGRLPREAAHARLAACHAAVVPSRSETYGLAARELAAMGLPLALSDLAAFRDIEIPGVAVERFAVDDATGLARVLRDWVDRLEAGRWPPAPSATSSTGSRARRPTDHDAEPVPGPSDGTASARASSSSAHAARISDPEASSATGDGSGRVPLVSVVVPFYEMHRTLEACLDSIAADPHPAREIVLVDDGSESDAARASVEALRERFAASGGGRVVVQANQGLASARNAGVRAARGDYVLPLDPDDLIVPGYLAAGVAALERRPELDFVVGISGLFDDGADPERPGEWIVPYDPDRALLFLENGAGTAAAIFRRPILERFGYRSDLPAYEDWDLHLRLATAGVVGESLPVVFHRYRQRRGGLAHRARPHHAQLVARMLAPHLEALDPDVREALELHVDLAARVRGVGGRPGPIPTAWVERIESLYRRRLKSALRDALGTERRDRLAALARRWIRGA